MYIHSPMHTRSGDTTSYHTDQEPMRAEGTDTHTHRDRATKNLCLCSYKPLLIFHFISRSSSVYVETRGYKSSLQCNTRTVHIYVYI